ncbi:MAG: cytochrome c [Flavobacteriaceae bacterium]|nr:cytochrome c [Flavobacteriaceae bacterium]
MKEQKRLRTLRLLSYGLAILMIVFVLNYDYFVTSASKNQSASWCGVIVEEKGQSEGRKLFRALCASCHKLDKKFIGSALSGISERYSEDYLVQFITNEQALLDSQNKDAIAINIEYLSKMDHNFKLTKEQVIEILNYLD